MSYKDNSDVKTVIDCVLRRNAKLFTDLGIDSSPEEYAKAKELEVSRLQRVRHLDPQKVDRLLIE